MGIIVYNFVTKTFSRQIMQQKWTLTISFDFQTTLDRSMGMDGSWRVRVDWSCVVLWGSIKAYHVAYCYYGKVSIEIHTIHMVWLSKVLLFSHHPWQRHLGLIKNFLSPIIFDCERYQDYL